MNRAPSHHFVFLFFFTVDANDANVKRGADANAQHLQTVDLRQICKKKSLSQACRRLHFILLSGSYSITCAPNIVNRYSKLPKPIPTAGITTKYTRVLPLAICHCDIDCRFIHPWYEHPPQISWNDNRTRRRPDL